MYKVVNDDVADDAWPVWPGIIFVHTFLYYRLRGFFQHFFGKDKQVLVRKFELGNFLRELDQF